VYSPPEGEDSIRRLLHNLCEFLYREEDDIDPLIKLAIAHYQFEAIHPFPDGNGRTGRVLNILFLIERSLLEIPVLYLSRYIIQNKAEYYRGLRSVTEEEAWEDWVSYMLQAIEVTAIETRQRIQAIHEAMSQAKETIKQGAPKMYSHELVEVIFSQPYTRISFLEERGLAKRQTASSYLKRLEELGLLKSVKVWRETLYLNPKLMELLAA
jgi:Fic family protein